MPMINQVTPMLHVPDIKTALEYFVALLGFEILFRMTNYAYLERDGAGIRVLEETGSSPVPQEKARMTVYFDVIDVDALFAELQPRLATTGIEYFGPKDQHWNQRELQIRMPDGHWLTFGQPMKNPIPHTH